MTAPCPPKTSPCATGETIARVTPPARLTATGDDSGLTAGAISMAAEKGDFAPASLV